MLKEYVLLSWYKNNINKTQVLLLNYDPPEEIRHLYNWIWHAGNIKYLAVILPKLWIMYQSLSHFLELSGY